MFIIDNYTPYLVRNAKAYKVSFGENGQIKVSDTEDIDVKGKNLYTYDEIRKKFNVDYIIEMKKKELTENKEIASLKEENKKLKQEIADLKGKTSKKSK